MRKEEKTVLICKSIKSKYLITINHMISIVNLWLITLFSILNVSWRDISQVLNTLNMRVNKCAHSVQVYCHYYCSNPKKITNTVIYFDRALVALPCLICYQGSIAHVCSWCYEHHWSVRKRSYGVIWATYSVLTELAWKLTADYNWPAQTWRRSSRRHC